MSLLLCLVVHVADADTIRCATGERIRLAGISGLERDNSCNSVPFCPTMPFAQAKAVAEREMLGQTLTFRIVGQSYNRFVGDHMPTRCRLIRSGAVVAWPTYERRYGLRGCP